MKERLIRQFPKGCRLEALGDLSRVKGEGHSWRIKLFLVDQRALREKQFRLDASCYFARGRQFVYEPNQLFLSGKFTRELILPATHKWDERTLGEGHGLPAGLAGNPEIARQRCFVFRSGGLTIWLPKFELARYLFFRAGYLTRAAFEPNGLDMLFNKRTENGDIHIYTPSKTGAPARIIQQEECRDHISWLLLNKDIKQSFESVYRHLNKEQYKAENGEVRWQFNFSPPQTLSGMLIKVRGRFLEEEKEMLVWEIDEVVGATVDAKNNIFFHHPSLKQSIRGEAKGLISPKRGGRHREIDLKQETDEAESLELLDVPSGKFSVNREGSSSVVYDGRQVTGYGQDIDEIEEPPGSPGGLGIGEAVIGGTATPGEFHPPEEKNKWYQDRFVILKALLKQMAEEEQLELFELKVDRLPTVSGCRMDLMENDTPRCFLVAGFRLKDGGKRYLLEIDTSDQKRKLSTIVVSFKLRINSRWQIAKIMKSVVRKSLRWPQEESVFGGRHWRVKHYKDKDSVYSSVWYASLMKVLK